MSVGPKKFHGDELKCAGIPICRDCTEKALLTIDLSALVVKQPEWLATMPKETCTCIHCEYHNRRY